ncbi:VOC family protein [Rossellomorea vietnamensis]|uniref:VOC family protein n=1 Tax=Rossellomorea vietnamensis TaxID=218284 RepID=A0A5D4M826_9BACI|nr:VOC family protein [Rossellomorea vietnamensis]TYR97802.1 VOC family protein [Rossellomorea vietnamensis]
MHTGATFQIRVTGYEKGIQWYKALFNREPDFIPHEDFAEWEIVKGAWLQVAKGEPAIGSGPLRLGVRDIEAERTRLMDELNITIEEINTHEGVPAAWCSFEDQDGNKVGLFQELNVEKA